MTKSQFLVIGNPIKHSLSPIIYNYFFNKLNLEQKYIYNKLLVNDLDKFINSLKNNNIKGFNITIPHKEDIIKYCHHMSEESKIIKAINTVKIIDGKLYGHNTDHLGFIDAIKYDNKDYNFHNKNALLMGAGGSAKAIIYGLIKNKVKNIFIANRDKSKISKIINLFPSQNNIKAISYLDIEDIISNIDLIINSTSIGMKNDDPELFDYNLINKNSFIVDIVYNKYFDSNLIKKCKKNNIRCQNGIKMLLFQAISALKIYLDYDYIFNNDDIDKIINLLNC